MKMLLMSFCFFIGLNSFASEDNFEVERIVVTNLKNYQGNYLTLYLVHGNKLLGLNPTINKVMQILGTKKITSPDVAFDDVRINESTDQVFNPNYVIAVVHSNEKNALNKNPSGNSHFAHPDYLNPDKDKVEATEANKSEIARASVRINALQDLNSGLSIALPR
jgi:hypothetical protein